MTHISKKARQIYSPLYITQSKETGSSGERRFYDSCKSSNLDIKKTSAKLDVYHHTDFVVNGHTFDVKGLKQSHQQGLLILEIKNVSGKIGWCNNENKPEYIAFDFGAFFLCAKNSDLFQLVQKKCNLKKSSSKASECLYKSYTRPDRKDLITMVKLNDILNECDHWFLPYAEYKQPMELL